MSDCAEERGFSSRRLRRRLRIRYGSCSKCVVEEKKTKFIIFEIVLYIKFIAKYMTNQHFLLVLPSRRSPFVSF